MSAHSGNNGPHILTQQQSCSPFIMHIPFLIRFGCGIPFLLFPDKFRYVHHLPGSYRCVTLEFLSWSILVIQVFLPLFQEKGTAIFKRQEKDRSLQQSLLSLGDTFQDLHQMSNTADSTEPYIFTDNRMVVARGNGSGRTVNGKGNQINGDKKKI